MGSPDGSVLDGLIRAEEEVFLARMPRSAALWERGRRSLPGGVCSSWASSRPLPVWVSHGDGALVYDADGTEYVDMHAGYGVNVVGHANPAVVRAVQERVTMGTHFAQPTADAIDVAENLTARFGLPKWRFTNSGTEAVEAAQTRKILSDLAAIAKGHESSLQALKGIDEDPELLYSTDHALGFVRALAMRQALKNHGIWFDA